MEQLTKIIPLLSSDQPGEVVAAAAAIGRLLAAGGRDWHWLAQTASGAPATQRHSSVFDTAKLVGEVASLRAEVSRLEGVVRGLRIDLARTRNTNEQLLRRNAALREEVDELRRGTEQAPRDGRLATRARMMLGDPGWGALDGARQFVAGVLSALEVDPDLALGPLKRDVFDSVWREYRRR